MALATQTSGTAGRAEKIENFIKASSKVILGKEDQLRLTLCTILARGHLLIEDVPGVGKTTLVKMVAKALGLKDSRVQFTNDLLPADLMGTSIFDSNEQRFRFHEGPFFAQLIIADELNRATPKTQGACLQAMEERQISVDGQTHKLPEPFVVIATQNPMEQVGTYPLPESQLDRFLMRIHLGYPDSTAEKELLKGSRRELLLEEMQAVFSAEDVLRMQSEVDAMGVSDALVDYIQRILQHSRVKSADSIGLSPRAGLALVQAAKSWAYICGRDMVLPEDVQAVGPSVVSHRLSSLDDLNSSMSQARAEELFRSVRVD